MEDILINMEVASKPRGKSYGMKVSCKYCQTKFGKLIVAKRQFPFAIYRYFKNGIIEIF